MIFSFPSRAPTHKQTFIIYFDGEFSLHLRRVKEEFFVLAQSEVGKSMKLTLEPEKCFGAKRVVCCCVWENEQEEEREGVRAVSGKSQYKQK